jgi:hypothetical protein
VSLAKAMGRGRKVKRQRHVRDNYATPHACTVALVRAEMNRLEPIGIIWEPAVGTGAIRDVLTEFGLSTYSSDIAPRVKGAIRKSFTEFDEVPKVATGKVGAIITNPPFGSQAPEKFVRHALRLNIPYVALFLPSDYFSAATRLRLYSIWHPARVYPLTWRPDWTGEGGPVQNMTWFVWDAFAREQVFKPLPFPGKLDMPPELPFPEQRMT